MMLSTNPNSQTTLAHQDLIFFTFVQLLWSRYYTKPGAQIFFFFFPPLLFPRRRSLLDDCFTGQSPGSAISIPAAPDVHEGLGQIQASAP